MATPLLSRGLQASSARGRYVPPCKIRHVYHRFPLLYLTATRRSMLRILQIHETNRSLPGKSFICCRYILACGLLLTMSTSIHCSEHLTLLCTGNRKRKFSAASKCRSNACVRINRTCTRTRRFRLKRKREGEDGWVSGRDRRNLDLRGKREVRRGRKLTCSIPR